MIGRSREAVSYTERPMTQKRYITTPIYYVNADPHIGHIYTTTVCDVWARFSRLSGQDTFFLTGTDEHGLKVEQSAQEKGIAPKQFADEISASFRNVMNAMDLTFDDFIRTTDPGHERQVQLFVERLQRSDAVYLGEFEGWYDQGQEEYYTETQAKELEYNSPISKKPLVRAREKNYYFRLSAFQERLEQHFKACPDFVRPSARYNEVLGRLREGLNDVPMSRTNFTWGIQMPNDSDHVIYVWIDALFNYITALGLAEPESELAMQRSDYWPATYHVIGKEILWFHAVIWPAILMALEIPLPACIYAHSFWISEGQKMSKSMGNFIDCELLDRYRDAYGLDALRYFMATQGPLGATDSNFAASQFHETYAADLVNTLGNCASRVTAMIGKYFEGQVPNECDPDGKRISVGDTDWPLLTQQAAKESAALMADFNLSGSIAAAMGIIRKVDAFINATEPFKLAKDPEQQAELSAILYQCAEAIRIAGCLLWPVIPDRCETLFKALGQTFAPGEDHLQDLTQWGRLQPGTSVEKIALFPRIDAALDMTTS